MRVATLVLAVFAAVLAVSTADLSSGAERIIGGSLTTINQYPYSASLLYSYNLVTYWQQCGGTIINNRAVLTAAHCFTYNYWYPEWRIRVGSSYANSGGTVHNTYQIIRHPSYNSYTLDNDIAIVRSATYFVFLPNAVQPGSIAGANYNLPDNQVVWAIGWGLITVNGPLSEQLRHVQVWTINQVTCRNRYAELNWNVTDNMVCSGYLDVGGRDQCTQDYGSPLIHNNVIVGVTSFAYSCALPRYPRVNTRVSRYTAWIQANA